VLNFIIPLRWDFFFAPPNFIKVWWDFFRLYKIAQPYFVFVFESKKIFFGDSKK
jgi:hypothetical protein